MTIETLRQLRKRLKWTQAQMSEFIGVHKVTVAYWEIGSRPIPHWMDVLFSADKAWLIHQALNHDPERIRNDKYNPT